MYFRGHWSTMPQPGCLLRVHQSSPPPHCSCSFASATDTTHDDLLFMKVSSKMFSSYLILWNPVQNGIHPLHPPLNVRIRYSWPSSSLTISVLLSSAPSLWYASCRTCRCKIFWKNQSRVHGRECLSHFRAFLMAPASYSCMNCYSAFSLKAVVELDGNRW